MRCRKNTYITFNRLVATDALKGTFLQYAQDLDLHRHTHIADLIKKQGSTFSHFKTPLAGSNGAGKGSLLMSKQFAFQQVFRNGATVDRHKRLVAAVGMHMQFPGGDFLAGTGFTEYQYRGTGIGHLLNHLVNFLGSMTFA